MSKKKHIIKPANRGFSKERYIKNFRHTTVELINDSVVNMLDIYERYELLILELINELKYPTMENIVPVLTDEQREIFIKSLDESGIHPNSQIPHSSVCSSYIALITELISDLLNTMRTKISLLIKDMTNRCMHEIYKTNSNIVISKITEGKQILLQQKYIILMILENSISYIDSLKTYLNSEILSISLLYAEVLYDKMSNLPHVDIKEDYETFEEEISTYKLKKIFNWKELDRLALDNNFKLRNCTGSHRIYNNMDTNKIIIIPAHTGRDMGLGLSIKIQKDILGVN